MLPHRACRGESTTASAMTCVIRVCMRCPSPSARLTTGAQCRIWSDAVLSCELRSRAIDGFRGRVAPARACDRVWLGEPRDDLHRLRFRLIGKFCLLPTVRAPTGCRLRELRLFLRGRFRLLSALRRGSGAGIRRGSARRACATLAGSEIGRPSGRGRSTAGDHPLRRRQWIYLAVRTPRCRGGPRVPKRTIRVAHSGDHTLRRLCGEVPRRRRPCPLRRAGRP